VLRAALAALVLAAPVSHRDLSYDLGSPPAVPAWNRLDVYSPAGARRGSRPVVVWVHGGGWQEGDKREDIARKARLFTRADFVLASVNYRLSGVAPPAGPFDPGRVRFPDHPRDVAEAVGWLRRHVARYGGDPGRIVLVGHSSGAHLAALVGTDPRYLRARGVPRRTLRGVVTLDAAALDVTRLADPRTNEGARGIWSVFGTPEEDAATGAWAAASPLRHADRGDPPFLQVVSNGSPRANAREARRMAGRVGGPLLRVPFDHVEIGRNLGAPRAVLRFVSRVTRRAPGRSPGPGGSSAARR
jgi:acetyl esterase/lipase